MEIAILSAGGFVFVAYLLEFIFDKTRIPDILMLMLLGLLAGPVFGLVQLEWFGEVGKFVSSLALVVILFESGLTLNLGARAAAAGRAVPFAIITMGGSVAAITWLLSVFIGLDLWMAICGAFILSGTSSAVVIPMLKGLKTRESVGTVLMLESAITDVLCIIGAVGIATALAAGATIKAGGLAGTAAVSMLAATALGVTAGLTWAFLSALVTKLRNAMFTTLAFALVVYGSAEVLGISGAIAALALGVTLGNLPKADGPTEPDLSPDSGDTADNDAPPAPQRSRRFAMVTGPEMKLYAEVVFLLKASFFFYLGLNVRPEAFVSALGAAGAVMAVATFIPRYPAVVFFISRKMATRREALTAWALGPRGLAAAVLAQIPVQLGLPGATELAEVVALMVFLSITLVAFLVFFIERGWMDPFGGFLFAMYPDTSTAADAQPPSEAQPPDSESASADEEHPPGGDVSSTPSSPKTDDSDAVSPPEAPTQDGIEAAQRTSIPSESEPTEPVSEEAHKDVP